MKSVSIIVPIYKGKKYIENIIRMVEKNQENTKDATIELIFVNDYPDELITEADIPQTSLNVSLLTNEVNQGIHQSRVNGLNAAKGQYIHFFDQDDEMAENYIDSQLKHIGNADIVVGNGSVQFPDYDKLLYRYWLMQWTAKHLWFYMKFGCRIISPGHCIIKKSAIPTCWGNHIMQKNGADDYFLWVLMFASGKKFAINREQIYIHVNTNENASLDLERMARSEEEVFSFTGDDLPAAYFEIVEKRRRMGAVEKNAFIKLVERINRK